MADHYVANVLARRRGAIGAFGPVRVYFRSEVPLVLRPDRDNAAMAAAHGQGLEVNHVIDMFDAKEDV